jgi:hypothetical protein
VVSPHTTTPTRSQSPTTAEPWPESHWLVLVLLTVFGLALYWPVFSIRPLDGDNYYILAWVDAAPASRLLQVDPAIYPEWRPLAFISVWIEHRLVQLRAVAVHHGVNLALWIACCWLVYRIVDRLCQSRIAGAVVAVVLLSDPRAMPLMTWIIERQTSLACAFGLVALYVAAGARDRNWTRSEGAAICGCLLCAGLSKEYGLAFAGAFLIDAVWHRRSEIVWPLAAIAGYAAMRLVFAGGALGVYCEDMGFLQEAGRQCIDPASSASLRQMAYNAAVAVVSIPVDGVFTELGALSLSRSRAIATAALALVAAIGVVRGHRITSLIALVALGNGLLGFMVYRPRNIVAGACAMAILAGVGMAIAQRWPAAMRPRAVVTIALAALLAVVLGQQVGRTQALVAQEVASMLDGDPCDAVELRRAFGDRFTTRIKLQFAMSDPHCGNPP